MTSDSKLWLLQLQQDNILSPPQFQGECQLWPLQLQGYCQLVLQDLLRYPISSPYLTLSHCPPFSLFLTQFMDDFCIHLYYTSSVYVHTLLVAMNGNYLTTFWGCNKLPGQREYILDYCGNWGLKKHTNIHTYIPKGCYMSHFHWEGPVVAYCNLQKMGTQPQVRRSPWVKLDKPDQKMRSDYPNWAVLPTLPKKRSQR